MSKLNGHFINDEWIVKKRGKKNKIDPYNPYFYLIEKELMHTGVVEDVITIFLANRECPFKCLMCDLWKNTTDVMVPVGAIPQQIQYALKRLPEAKHVKLYNSGNFFDTKAIPKDDYQSIAELVEGFETLIVECHPKLINEKVLQFSELIKPQLQIAMGLETVHPEILPMLNKKMSTDDFKNAARFLTRKGILVRAFILLGLPGLTKEESKEWAKKSIEFAFNAGVECCVVIPTRTGNGAMELLQGDHFFQEPDASELLEVLEYGLTLEEGRVFADTWDLERFANGEELKKKIIEMNGSQTLI